MCELAADQAHISFLLAPHFSFPNPSVFSPDLCSDLYSAVRVCFLIGFAGILHTSVFVLCSPNLFSVFTNVLYVLSSTKSASFRKDAPHSLQLLSVSPGKFSLDDDTLVDCPTQLTLIFILWYLYFMTDIKVTNMKKYSREIC